MKRFLFLTCLFVALQANAQFSYSVKAGWSWSDIRYGDGSKSTPTIGGNVNYTLNKYFGLQSGLAYKQVKEKAEVEYGSVGDKEYFSTGHFLEIPLLFTANVIPEPRRWKWVWHAGMFVDIPVADSGRFSNGSQTYYGIMAAAEIEIRSHYLIRGEYQWALRSDSKLEWDKDRRTNILSVCLGYRF